MNRDKLNLLLVHGSPRKINEYLFEDRDEKSLHWIMEQADADILCFGHIHKPYHRVLNSGTAAEPYFRHTVNIGSVGKSKYGDLRGGYVLLSFSEDSGTAVQNSIMVEFIRFDYDVGQAALAIEKSPLPNAYADLLRKA